MIMTITPSAIAYFKHFLSTQAEGVHMVFSVSHSGCSGLKYQTEALNVAEDDAHYEHCESDGFGYYVHRDAMAYLQGMVVDCQSQQLGEQKIVYLNPKATGLCGCGESFKLKEDQDGAV